MCAKLLPVSSPGGKLLRRLDSPLGRLESVVLHLEDRSGWVNRLVNERAWCVCPSSGFRPALDAGRPRAVVRARQGFILW